MRATASSGDADFEGVVSWSGELGYGVRAPEPAQELADGHPPATRQDVRSDEAATGREAH
jgi:NADH-quinone oxidoreductase subunit I